MATLHASVATSSKLVVLTADSSFSGRLAVQSFSPRLHPARNKLLKRRGNSVVSASKDEASEKKVPLWRKELISLEDATGENYLQNASMEEDIARLQKKRDLEKRMERYNRKEEKPEGDGMAKSVVEKILVADFFFILFILAWLVAGLVERSLLESTALIDSWLPLWSSVFQPALGVFMAGALVSAVSGLLSKSGNQ